jgi:hypothetical protein
MKMSNDVPSKALEWTNLILGAGLGCAAFMFTELPVAAWNMGIVGALIACCSAVALYRYAPWTEWSNLTLGCWAIAAPFLFGFGAAPAPTWTFILVGFCVASIATMQLMASRKGGTSSSTGSFAGE